MEIVEKTHIKIHVLSNIKLNVILNSCFEAFNTSDIKNIWLEIIPVKNGGRTISEASFY